MLRSLYMAFSLVTLSLLMLAAPASADPRSVVPAQSEESAPPKASGIGIRLLDIPAATQDDPRARSYIVDRVAPGTTIERRVQVQNNTGSPQSVHIYAGAARIDEGSFIGEDGATENELTTWISLDQPQLEMAAGASTDVLVTIDVPADAPEDEQYAAIWAEVRSQADAESNIISASRVGIRIYLSVGPGNGAPAGFEITSLTAKRNLDGNPEVVASVTNIGGRALDISGSLSLTEGPSGLSAGPFATETVTTVAPGDTGELAVTLDSGIPNGPWQAQLDLKSGLVTRTTTADLTFPEAGESELVPSGEGPNMALVAGGVGAIAVLVVGLTLWLRARRRSSITRQNTSLQ